MSQASVLVVEDNDLERQITADTLRDEGFAVDEAPIGKRALELLALGALRRGADRPDDARDVGRGTAGARSSCTTRRRQVVVLTAHGTIDSAVQAMKNGAFYYLTKPTDRETLVMTVGKAAELANLQQENQTAAHAAGGQASGRRNYRAGPGDPGSDQDRAQGRAVEFDGADPGRERHRQGSDRARDPSAVAARRRVRSSRSTARRFPTI